MKPGYTGRSQWHKSRMDKPVLKTVFPIGQGVRRALGGIPAVFLNSIIIK
jgi:hypothetical protein